MVDKDLQWDSQLKLMERDAPELRGIVIAMSGAPQSMRQTRIYKS